MSKHWSILAFATSLLLAFAPSVHAHFLWIVTDGGKVEVYFNETCTPGEADLLQRVTGAKVWALSNQLRAQQPFQDLAIVLADGSLAADQPENVGMVGLSHDYDILTRGDKTFLLRYYAKTYTSPIPGSWKELNNAERLALEITPKWRGGELQLKVLWKGRPAREAEVVVSGCGFEQETLQTDGDGVVTVKPKESGLLSIRTKQEELVEGAFDGKPYASIRSYSTLSLPVILPEVKPVVHGLPDLEKGLTSFGAAIVGEDLYVYGGHFGMAHHYSKEGQSNELRRISLNSERPTWEVLPEGPKLTGLAMVAHNGKLYRVGGFSALNDENADQDLHSQSSFAAYDPTTKSWSDLTPLPEGRSSHDAAVLDGKLYVIGGWKLGGSEPTVWHKTALVCDLNAEKPTWEEISSPPFKRRALSVAAYKGKIYAIGGMEETNSVSLRVDIYDPQTREWSAGPSLLGAGMDGFGTSAFANNDVLVVTTMSGSILRLSEDGKEWKLIGQMEKPRFFHRQLVTANGDFLLVGGGSMETGKVVAFERFQVGK